MTKLTRMALAYRRAKRDWGEEGFEELSLMELRNGPRWDHVITEVRIAPDGKSLFLKIERRKA